MTHRKLKNRFTVKTVPNRVLRKLFQICNMLVYKAPGNNRLVHVGAEYVNKRE